MGWGLYIVRIGKSARLVAMAAMAALLGVSSAQAETCGLKRFASFDISSNPDGMVTIPVTFNGTAETVLVDTGGVYSTVSPSVVAALRLKPQLIRSGFELYMADGTLLNHYATIDRLGIGGAGASDVHLIIQPQHSQTGIEDFQGTLAPDLLPNFDLDFDFAHHTLNFFSQQHCEGKVVYWANSYAVVPFSLDAGSDHIEVPVTLDGKDFTALIDTGSAHTLLSAKAARDNFGLTPDSPGMMPVPGETADALVRYAYRFKTLTLNGITVNNPMIGLLRDAMEQGFWKRHDEMVDRDPIYGLQFRPNRVTVGMNVLRKLHLYIAYKEKKLYVTAADAGIPAPAPAATASPAAPAGPAAP